jgi:Asp-tRNA(Asn)/Glu-tRNA(Gln) amidotransferase A subunit family amidase
MMSARDQLSASIAAYSEWEPDIHAFAWADTDRALALAEALDHQQISLPLPLSGMPIGVKDIFDTCGIPTELGSSIFAGRVPTESAEVVHRLEVAGAIVFGKTVTAELAHYAPGPTANPWKLDRTPGGSSMGSAAAVAAGVVPAAIGSQTNGSVIRPAAFCGIVGFKPTAGRLPTRGALRVSPTVDQVGTFATTSTTAASIAAVMAGQSVSDWVDSARKPAVIAAIDTEEWSQADQAAVDHYWAVVATLERAGASVVRVSIPHVLADVSRVHRTIVAIEAHRNVAPLVEGKRAMCSRELISLLDDGGSRSEAEYGAALARRLEMIDAFDQWGDRFDAILAMPTLGEAPPLATTGDPRFCTRWTLLGAPAITVPTGLGPNHLPLGTQIIGGRHRDRQLISISRWVESVVTGPGQPAHPTSRRSTYSSTIS